jgi:hypothetical protein
MKSDAPTILPFPCASSCGGRRALRKHLLSALRVSGSPVIVDFSGCSSLNSEDIDLLLECLAQVGGRDAKMLFVAGSLVNRVLLEVTRIPSVVPVFNSVKEALNCLEIGADTAEDQPPSESQKSWSA